MVSNNTVAWEGNFASVLLWALICKMKRQSIVCWKHEKCRERNGKISTAPLAGCFQPLLFQEDYGFQYVGPVCATEVGFVALQRVQPL